jgi:hypothetical protein
MTRFRRIGVATGAATLLVLGCGETQSDPGQSEGNGGNATAAGGNAHGAGASGGSQSNGGSSSTDGGTSNGAASSGAAPNSGGAPELGEGGAPAGGAGGLVDCNPAHVLCKLLPDECPEMQVHRVDGTCWGECVKIDRCACSSEVDCPDSNQYTCWSGEHCGPYVH